MSVFCRIYCAPGLYRLLKIRKMVWPPDPGATRPRQPSPPRFHVGFQRWYAEQVLAPPDGQALLLPELVRDNHLALLELWRPTIVRCLVADQVIVRVYDLSAVRPSWIGRRGLIVYTFDDRVAECCRPQHCYFLRLKLVAECDVKGLEKLLRAHVIAFEVVQTAADLRHEPILWLGSDPPAEKFLDGVHDGELVRLRVARHIGAAGRVNGNVVAHVLPCATQTCGVLDGAVRAELDHKGASVGPGGHPWVAWKAPELEPVT